MSGHFLGFATRRLFSAAALCLCACSGSGSTGASGDLGVGDLATGTGNPGTDDLGTGTGIMGLHATQAQGRYFPSTAPWYQDVSSAQVAADSSAITQWMVGYAQPNGWGTGKMKVDFSIGAVNVPSGTLQKNSYPVGGAVAVWV